MCVCVFLWDVSIGEISFCYPQKLHLSKYEISANTNRVKKMMFCLVTIRYSLYYDVYDRSGICMKMTFYEIA